MDAEVGLLVERPPERLEGRGDGLTGTASTKCSQPLDLLGLGGRVDAEEALAGADS